MKVFIILLLAALAGAVGFLCGTEQGRQRRDDVIRRIRRTTDDAVDTAADAADGLVDATNNTVERLSA